MKYRKRFSLNHLSEDQINKLKNALSDIEGSHVWRIVYYSDSAELQILSKEKSFSKAVKSIINFLYE